MTLASGHKVWTRRLGEDATKVLLLHGGPGVSHAHMGSFADHLPQAGYEMHFYDLLGCGRSERPDDTSLWTLPHYRDEVGEARAAFGLDRVVPIGHRAGAASSGSSTRRASRGMSRVSCSPT